MAMDFNEIRKLIDTLIEKNIAEFELEEEGRRIRVKRGGVAEVILAQPHAPSQGPVAASAAAATAATTSEEAGLVTVTSPIVGTYYESPSPGAPEFIKPGDSIEVGQVLCIVEAMKLMNEIEAETAGQLVRKLVTNGQPVEFGQPLLLIRPRG